MQINYIILAHKNPKQLRRRLLTLQSAVSNFYIHIDKNVDIDPFIQAVKDINGVTFVADKKRKYITWGDFNIVAATIDILKQTLKDNRKGYFILLSGQDYPTRSTLYIESFLERNYGQNFITCFPMPYEPWSKEGGMERLEQYKFNVSSEKYDFVLFPSLFDKKFDKNILRKKLSYFPYLKRLHILFKILKKRKLPNDIIPYGGDQLWALPHETVVSILNLIQKKPGCLSFHLYSTIPDEIFFQSVVMHLIIMGKIKNNMSKTLTYINWERKDVDLPVTFIEKDFQEIISQNEFLFARKFDITIDEIILEKLDAHIQSDTLTLDNANSVIVYDKDLLTEI